MVDLHQSLESMLQLESTLEFLTAKETLEKDIYEADVVALSIFRDVLPEIQEEHGIVREDLEELIDFLDKLDEGEDDVDFPEFALTKIEVEKREQSSIMIKERVSSKLDVIKTPLGRLVRIMNKVAMVERFIKMRIIHQWFMIAITEYVEVVEYEKAEVDPNKETLASLLKKDLRKSPLLSRKRTMREKDNQIALRTFARLGQDYINVWFEIWKFKSVNSTLSKDKASQCNLIDTNEETYEKAALESESKVKERLPFILKLFNCMVFQRTRPSFMDQELNLVI